MNFKKLRNSFGSAFVGVYRLLRDEQNARIHFAITILVFALAIVVHISRVEASILFIAVILVFGLEIINTSIEDLLDHLHPQQHETVAKIKDGMSGAVLIAAIIATVVGVLIFLPYLLDAAKNLGWF